MKIALVCGHYLPDLGYIEVHLARALKEENHDILVITSDAVPSYVKKLTNGFGENASGIEVVRLKPVFTLGQMVVARGIRRKLKKWNPDFVIAIGMGKRFVLPVFGAGYPVMAMFGDNAQSYGMHTLRNRLKNRVLFSFFKRKVYRAAVKTADILVAYTPESFAVAGRSLGGKKGRILSGQNRFIHLGFWPNEFFFDETLRQAKRAELGYDTQDVILVTATRISPEKNLKAMVPVLRSLPAHFKWLVIGGAEDAETEGLLAALEKDVGHSRYLVLHHAPRETLNAYYCASDMAVFTVPAISIIEAAGTGLPLVLPEAESLSALKQLGFRSAVWSESVEDTAGEIEDIADDVRERKSRALRAKEHLSWPVQARKLTAWMDEVIG